mmetsp:Transcript_10393/g.17873  ORF Transcript_10393/g.17873 Transcript_10393/m.17873 type:complete len:130 (-) Transcript_10393:23-412(-)
MLKQRLQECTLDKLAAASGADASVLEAGLELLATSDNRITCLIAEANLLEMTSLTSDESDANAFGNASLEKVIRKGFAELLTENAQLRKSQNSLLRNAIVMNSSANEHDDGFASKRSLFRRLTTNSSSN